MAIRSNIVTLVSALAVSCLVACGGTAKEAKGPEANPWADYKGTYATSAAPREPKTEAAKSEAPKEAPAPVEEVAAVEETPAPAPAPTKKAKSAPKAAKAPAKTAKKK
jgi:outer membrane biosynthesis protein TonB